MFSTTKTDPKIAERTRVLFSDLDIDSPESWTFVIWKAVTELSPDECIQEKIKIVELKNGNVGEPKILSISYNGMALMPFSGLRSDTPAESAYKLTAQAAKALAYLWK